MAMSRIDESGDYDSNFPNEWAFWERRTRQVMSGKPMRKALAELREALLALPEKRLISRAFSTVGKTSDDPDPYGERTELLETEGEGVCAVGAFVWHKKVKAGADPEEALRDLPLLPDYDGYPDATADQGKATGLSWTLAWLLMDRNDRTYEGMTPEERYEAYLAWIDAKLAEPATGDKAAV
jgi:hypothetical protein